MSDITLSRDLYARGLHANELVRLVRGGELTRVRRGAYVSATPEQLQDQANHVQLLEATLRQSSPDAVVSHGSAAVLHGLPFWRSQLQRVQLTADDAGHGKTRRYVAVHGIPLPESQVVALGGFRVTSLARTVLDLSCQLELWRGVAVGDVALQLGLDPAELTDLLQQAVRRYGIQRARLAASLLDRRSESPQESRSRVIFHLRGLPPPQPQYLVMGSLGQVVARCDFGWDELRTVGEFDGRVKYGRKLRPGQDLAEVLFAEKRREDAIRDCGWSVVRWVSDELDPPDAVLQRLRRAFARA